MMPRKPATILLLLLLAAAVFLAYLPALGSGFLNWDDPDTVVGNAAVTGGFGGLVDIWGGRIFSTWLPVYFSSLWLDHAIYGDAATGYHVTNLILHLLNALLVLAIVRRLTKRDAVAWGAAFLFALHPAAIQSVAWISERKGLLAFLFAGLSLLWFLKAAEADGGRRWIRHGAGAAFLVVALLAKGSALALPLILLAYVVALRWPERRGRWTADLAPYFAVAAVLAVVHLGIAREEGTAVAGAGPGLGALLVADLRVLGGYLRLLFLPFGGQSAIHDIPVGGFDGSAALGLLVIALFGAGLVLAWRRNRTLFFALAAELLALAPFNNLFPRTTVLFAERYLYLSLLGAAMAIALLVAAAARRGPPAAVPAALAAAVVLLGGFAVARARTWSDPVTLFTDAAEKAPGSWLAWMKKGEALSARERYREAADAFARAAENATTALDEVRARANLSGVRLATGEPAEALATADAAAKRLPELGREEREALTYHVEVNRGSALTALSRPAEAAEAYRAAARVRPEDAAPLAALSGALLAAGDPAKALEAGKEAARLDPDGEAANLVLAQAELATGDAGACRQTLADFLSRSPRSLDALMLLGRIELASSRPRAARERFAAALAVRPDLESAKKGMAESDLLLARSLWAQGERDEARTFARRARENDPDNGRILTFLGSVTPDEAEAEALLARAAETEDGARARELLATHRATVGLARYDAGAPDEAVALAARAIGAGAARLSGGGKLVIDATLPRLRALAAAPDAAGRRDALLGLLLALGDRTEEAEERFAAALKLAERADEFVGDAVWVALYVRGQARIAAGRPAAARDDFAILLETWPGDPAGARGLAEALFYLAADDAAKAGAEADRERIYADARDAAKRAVELAPEAIAPRLTLGEIEFAMGHTVDSLRIFREVRRDHPDAVEPMLELASLYRAHFQMTGDRTYLDAAKEELEKAVEAAPHEARARAALGDALLAGGDAARAATELGLAIAEDPTLVSAKESLADLYVRAGRSQLEKGGPDGRKNAKELAERAVALEVRRAGPHLLLAELDRLDRDYAPAQRELETARLYEPDSPEVADARAAFYKDLGFALLLRSQREKAMEAFRKAVDAGSKKVDLGPVQLLLAGGAEPAEPAPGDPEVRGQLEKRAEEARAAFDRAGEELEKGNLDAAAEAALRSLASFSTAEGWYRLGRIREAQEDHEEAIRAYGNAVAQKPSLSQAWLALGQIHFSRGEWEEARRAWQSFLDVAGDDVPREARERVRALLSAIRNEKTDPGEK